MGQAQSRGKRNGWVLDIKCFGAVLADVAVVSSLLHLWKCFGVVPWLGILICVLHRWFAGDAHPTPSLCFVCSGRPHLVEMAVHAPAGGSDLCCFSSV